MVRIFVGPALAAQTLTGGQAGYKIGVGTKESSTSMNKYQRTFVYVWRSGSGNVKTIIAPTSCVTEHTTAERGCVITVAGAAGDFSIQENDRIVVEIWWDLRDGTTSYTATLYWDGTTDVVEAATTSDAAGFFYCPQTLFLASVSYDRLASQSLTFSGVTSKIFETIRYATQTVSGAFSANRVLEYVRVATQNISGMFLAARLVELGKTATQTLSFSNSASRLIEVIRQATQSLGLSSASTRLAEYLKSATQGINFSSATTRLSEILKTASQGIGFTSSATKLLEWIKSASIGFTLTSNAARLAEWLKTASQNISFDNAANQLAEFSRAANQLLNLASSAFASVGGGVNEYVRWATQSIVATLAATRSTELGRTASIALNFASSGLGWLNKTVEAVASMVINIRVWGYSFDPNGSGGGIGDSASLMLLGIVAGAVFVFLILFLQRNK
jgi:hypothetical protein